MSTWSYKGIPYNVNGDFEFYSELVILVCCRWNCFLVELFYDKDTIILVIKYDMTYEPVH